MPKEKDLLVEDITSYLDYDHHDWPEFLIEDCQEFIESLHNFRLEKLWNNRQQFISYMHTLQEEYTSMLLDEDLAMQAQTTVQALFSLSCAEFASASKERIQIRELIEDSK